MTISLPTFSYPPCEHLSEKGVRACAKLSSIHGTEIMVSATKCNSVCKVGKVFDSDQKDQFIHTGWTSYAMQFGTTFFQRVKKSYADVSRSVSIPPWYPQLKNELR